MTGDIGRVVQCFVRTQKGIKEGAVVVKSLLSAWSVSDHLRVNIRVSWDRRQQEQKQTGDQRVNKSS